LGWVDVFINWKNKKSTARPVKLVEVEEQLVELYLLKLNIVRNKNRKV